MTNSEKLFERGCRVLPGGVNSPVRAFRAVGGTPRFIVKGLGSHILDADGLEYIDYVGSWGPMILGHSHPDILKAVYDRMVCGLSFGAPTGLEVEMAEKMVSMLPGVEMVPHGQFGNGGGHECALVWHAARPDETRSSSSRAAITVIRTRCSSAQEAARSRRANRTPKA